MWRCSGKSGNQTIILIGISRIGCWLLLDPHPSEGSREIHGFVLEPITLILSENRLPRGNWSSEQCNRDSLPVVEKTTFHQSLTLQQQVINSSILSVGEFISSQFFVQLILVSSTTPISLRNHSFSTNQTRPVNKEKTTNEQAMTERTLPWAWRIRDILTDTLRSILQLHFIVGWSGVLRLQVLELVISWYILW